MNGPLRPRAVVHRGHVEAHGLLVDKSLQPLVQIHARILAEHRPGTVVHDLGRHYAVIWPQPRRVEARASVGEALVRVGDGCFSACALDPREREQLERSSVERIAWAEGGVLQLTASSSATRVDLGAWLELDGFAIVDVHHLGPPPRRIELIEVPAADAEALFGDAWPEPDPERGQIIEALERRRAARASASAEGSEDASADASAGSSAGPAEPRAPGPFARAWRAIRERVFGYPPIDAAMSQRHERYVQETLDLFELGELDEALRRAIPTTTLGGNERSPPAPSMPSPRSTLDISRAPPSTTSSVSLDTQLFTRLRDVYARVATQLETEGRIDEAAFVYFELLHDSLAGVTLLERHGRYAMAAEIAEARQLSPELIVRLWFFAEQPQRAIRVARRTGVFAAAIRSLERSQPDAAARLRRIWAEHEAETGDFVAAIEALWPVVEQRERTREWIDRAQPYVGPATRARLLGLELELQPDAVEQLHARIEPELVDNTPDAATLRVELAKQIPQWSASPARDALASVVGRALLRDFGGPRDAELHAALGQLLAKVSNATLRVDLPRFEREPVPSLAQRSTTLERELSEREVGSLLPCDVAVLPDGGALVALGEAGILQLRRDGRIAHHYTAPAHELVVSAQGSVALGLSRRDAFVQIWRLDVGQRRARWWQDLRLDTWAPRHDDGYWFVADSDALFALDLLVDTAAPLWRVPLNRERVDRIHVGSQDLDVLMASQLGPELFHFELPALVLRQREDLLAFVDGQNPPPDWPPMLATQLIAWARDDGTNLHIRDNGALRRLDGLSLEPRAANENWLAIDSASEGGHTLELWRRRDQQVGFRLLALRTNWLRCTIANDTLWGIDERCRAWSISLLDGALGVTALR